MKARDAASSLSPEARQQQLLCCSLALAVLAAACRLPEVAELQDMTQLLPILLKVIESRGLTPILSRPGVKDAPGWSSSNDGSSISSRSSSSSSGNNDEVADASMGEGEFEHAHAVQDAAALSDALECLLALSSTSVASSSTGTDTSEGPNLGPSSLLQAAAVPQTVAACAAVVAAAVVSAPPTAGPAGQHLPAASTSQPAQSVHMRAALLAVTVIGTLLQAPRSFCWEMLTSNPRATAALVAALGHCIGNPLLLVHAGPAGTGASQQTGNASSSIGSNGEGDAAVLQLESLHLLLALLPIITTDAAFSHVQQHLQHAAGRCDESHGWAAAVRRGCAWILQSKATPVQKHSAMQVCGAMSSWWLHFM